MGIHHTVTRSIRGFAGIVLGPPKGFWGSTCPGGPYGLYVEGNQPLSGLGAIPLGPMRLGLVGTLKGAPPWLGGKPPPLGRRPPSRSHLEGADPPSSFPYI